MVLQWPLVGALVGCLLLGALQGTAADLTNTQWTAGRATFYAGAAAGGQCRYFGYYGNQIVAIGNEFWNNGAVCGGCYEIVCDPTNNNQPGAYTSGCIPGGPTLHVTLSDITDPCSAADDNCGGTGYHWDLDPSLYGTIGQFSNGGGIVYIKWRRVPCNHGKNLSVRMKDSINPWWLAFTVLDENGDGDIDHVDWSSPSSGWQSAPRLPVAGNTFQIGGYPNQPLTLRITQVDGTQLTLPGCIPPGPQSNQQYTCNTNFAVGGGSPPSNPPPVVAAPNPPSGGGGGGGGSNVCASNGAYPTQCYFPGESGSSGRYVCCDSQGCNGFNPNGTPNCAHYGWAPPNFGVGAGGGGGGGQSNPPPAASPPASGPQGMCGTGAASFFGTRCWFNSDPRGRYVCCDNQGCAGFNSDNLTPHCANYGWVPPNFGQ